MGASSIHFVFLSSLPHPLANTLIAPSSKHDARKRRKDRVRTFKRGVEEMARNHGSVPSDVGRVVNDRSESADSSTTVVRYGTLSGNVLRAVGTKEEVGGMLCSMAFSAITKEMARDCIICPASTGGSHAVCG